MNQSPSKEQIICMKFDSYIKKCCRNELRNIEKYKNRIRNREISIPDYSQINVESACVDIKIPDFTIMGHEILIEDIELLGALRKLSDRERELILLIHFTGCKPKDISSEMNVVERTIYNRHKKILIKLKEYMEGKV